MEEFKRINEKLNPILTEELKKNKFSDLGLLYYFASLTKEGLRGFNDKQIEESVIRFIFDKEDADEEI